MSSLTNSTPKTSKAPSLPKKIQKKDSIKKKQKNSTKKKKKEETGKQMNIKEMIEKIESGNKLKTEKKTEETEETWVQKTAREWEEREKDVKNVTKNTAVAGEGRERRLLRVANQLVDQQQTADTKDDEKTSGKFSKLRNNFYFATTPKTTLIGKEILIGNSELYTPLIGKGLRKILLSEDSRKSGLKERQPEGKTK